MQKSALKNNLMIAVRGLYVLATAAIVILSLSVLSGH